VSTPDPDIRWVDNTADLDPHEPTWLTAMCVFNRSERRALHAALAELADFPDLTIDYTEGRGWRYRNIRIRATGPTFAIRAALGVLRTHLEPTGRTS
jgi:hypothetical protein